MKKVRITKLPNKKHGGHTGFQTPPINNTGPNPGGYKGGNDPEIKVRKTLEPTSRENATLEAELGETVVTNLHDDGLPEFYNIGGKLHSRGGTPLNLPSNSFIFSNAKELKIKDENILKMFGKMAKKSGYTPAEISKNFNLNKYREILADPDSTDLQRNTAELMIKNHINKLGQLALAQESMKGFDNGVPAIAMGHIENAGLDPASFINPAEVPTPEQLAGYKDGGEIPKFKDGGSKGRRVKVIKAPQTSSRPTSKQNIPKDAVLWDPSKDGYVREDVRAGDYIKNPDTGRYEKVTGFKKKPYEGDFADDRLGGLQDEFGLLQDKIQDPKIREEIVRRYRDKIKSVKPNSKTGLTQADIDQAAGLSDDDIINTFLKKEKQVYGLGDAYRSHGDYDPKDLWDKGASRGLHKETMEKLGFEELSVPEVASFQTSYAVLQEMADDPEYKSELNDFMVTQIGLGDEPGAGTGKATISDIDGWDGNTTSGQAVLPKDTQIMSEDVPDVESEAPVKHLPLTTEEKRRAPFWTQDLVNMGVAGADYFGVKKYMPWQATPQWREAIPAFQDFRGAAQRINSGLASGVRQLGAFAGPQAFAARFANMQRGVVDPILQLQEAEYRGNQQIANQFEMFNKESLNRFNVMKADLDTRLWDKTAIANQQFDNAKRQARHSMAQAFNQAWTNRGKTQTMNEMRPDFNVDPVTGFTESNIQYDEPDGSPQSDSGVLDRAKKYKKENPDMSWDEAHKFAKSDMGIPEKPPVGVDPAAYMYPGMQ